MSSINNYKPIAPQINMNKENAPISSNVSLERKYSIAHKSRRAHDIVPKSNLAQYGQETLSNQTITLPHNLPHSKDSKDAEIIKKLSAIKSKKMIAAERIAYSGRPGSVLLAQKDRYSVVNRESRMSVAERGERYSFEVPTRTSFIEGQKAQVVEPARASVVEKESVRVNPVLESVAAQEEKHKEEIIPEKIENEKKKVNPETVDFKEQCNKIMEDYAPIIMESLKMRDKDSTPIYCLKKHKIPANLRAKMIDWMVEVLGSYKCSDQTFFLAVNTMDLFLQKVQTAQEVADLHLLGVTCMFMASKYEEIYPLRLSVVHEKIAHKKLSPDQIKHKEMEVFSALDYKLTNTTPYEFIMNAIFQLDLKEVMSPKLYDYLMKVCTYLAKANMYDYELTSKQTHSELAAATLFVAFKIIEQLDKTFPLAYMLNKTKEILKVEEDIVYDCATRILSVAKNFEKLYPNLENLKKFHTFNFNDISSIRTNEEKGKNSNTH